MELIWDVRKNWVALTAKALIVGVFFLSLYNLASFSQSADSAVNRSFSPQAEVNLYSLVDTLTDPDAFSRFRESRQSLDTLGAFYSALDDRAELNYLSSFTQNVPVREFAGGDNFDAGYGMPSGVRGPYVDPLSGHEVRDVKSIQMNRDTFDFYQLGLASGDALPWESIDYRSGRVPVLLGSNYQGVYEIGDYLQANLYSKEFTFEVSGFLEPASSMFYKNETNFYLDDYLLVPYPNTLDGFDEADQFFYGILYFAMVNGDITASKDLTADEVLEEISTVSRSTGFSDYSLINVPAYLVQFTLVKRIIQDNHALLVSIQVMLGVAVLGAVAAINIHLSQRRRRRDVVRWTLGHSRAALTETLALSWLLEALLMLTVFLTGIALMPHEAPSLLSGLVAALAVYAALDALHQRYLLGRLLAHPDRMDA
ncbi:hypothetical protein [Cellulomonas cellasea]|uniref:MacB-like periplasmic core domain-containing protein n=1 Tax=Cellulomonas cellasea TaxID=43670 RepID=A0A7W4UKF4_9CELL|nr:hypothetical protein [Cellulomonas cellasea]MBB2925534.1 hypothetical protein [Cellulomonas cellasea]